MGRGPSWFGESERGFQNDIREYHGNIDITEVRFKGAKWEIYIILGRKPNCPTQLWLVTRCNLVFEEKVPWRGFPDDIGLWVCLWRILFLIHWYRKARPTTGTTTPRQVVLDRVRKRDREGANKQLPPQLLLQLLLDFLPCLPSVMDCALNT